jgi:hypothetical protein
VIVCNTRGRGETGNKSDRMDADRREAGTAGLRPAG